MNAAAIARQCRAANNSAIGIDSGIDIEVVLETGSTNADLMARAAQLRRPTLLAAVHQSAGRGRAGRSWLSNPDSSLTFSLAWRFDGTLQGLTGLPLAVGVALAETLAALDVTVQLKWPNDLLKDGAKLAGVLIEAQSVPGAVWAVIGVGLNLAMPQQMEEAIGGSAACAPWLAKMEREALLARLADGLADAMTAFSQGGFKVFCARWNALHAWRGQQVEIIDRGVVLHQGCALGVDDSARLLLDTPAGTIAILAGDVSLRRREY